MQPLSSEEIHAAYIQGEPAVQALLEGWMKEVLAFTQSVEARVQVLEDQISKNSRNSGKPPSSDGFTRPAPKSLRKRSRKKSGGQVGHVGYTLKVVEKPEHVEVHRVEQCVHCHNSLKKVQVNRYEKRQVFDIRIGTHDPWVTNPNPITAEIKRKQALESACFSSGGRI